jgi:hypothetical protein
MTRAKLPTTNTFNIQRMTTIHSLPSVSVATYAGSGSREGMFWKTTKIQLSSKTSVCLPRWISSPLRNRQAWTWVAPT